MNIDKKPPIKVITMHISALFGEDFPSGIKAESIVLYT